MKKNLFLVKGKEMNVLVIDAKNFRDLINEFIKHDKLNDGEEYFFAKDVVKGVEKLYNKYILKRKGGIIKF